MTNKEILLRILEAVERISPPPVKVEVKGTFEEVSIDERIEHMMSEVNKPRYHKFRA